MATATSPVAPAPVSRFFEQIEDSEKITMGAKLQVWGGPETGKSHDAYENLPRPLIVIDADVAAGNFNDDRFDLFKRLGPDKVPDLESLIAFLAEFVADPRWHRHYKSVLIDSLTQLVDPAIATLGVDNSSAAPNANVAEMTGDDRSKAIAAQGRAQADWARMAKELTRLIRRVSALGVHVYVVAEERTKFVGNRPGEGEAGAKSSLSPKKFTHAFDLILQKTAKGEAIVRKSRYRKWAKDARLPKYAAAQDLAPIFAGAEAKAAGFEEFDAASAAHEELMELLKTLGSKARGGKIPGDEMREYLSIASNNELPEPAVRKVINKVKLAYVENGTQAAVA